MSTKSVVGSPYSQSDGLASRDHAMMPACFPAGPSRFLSPSLRTLIGRPKERPKVAGLISVKGGGDD